MIWGLSYWPTDIGGIDFENEFLNPLDNNKGIRWSEVKYTDDLSLFIFSNIGTQESEVSLTPNGESGWPFLIIVIGLPLFPSDDQLLIIGALLTVDPNLIEFPNLPS